MKHLTILFLLAGICFGTVSTTTVKTGPTVGDGSTVAFVFSFSYTATSEIVVTSRVTATGVATVQTETTHYSVSSPSDTGGTVTFVTAPASTVTITISRTTPQTQSNDIDASSYISLTALEASHDKAMRLIQELQEESTRTPKFPITDASSTLGNWGNSVDRASKFPYFGNDGVPTTMAGVTADDVVVSTYMETVLDDASAVLAMATLNGMPVFNVMNPVYGATGDGATNDTLAVQAGIDALAAGQTLFLPKGTYMYTTLAVTAANVTIRGEGRGTILKQISGTTDNGLIFTGADSFVLRDLAFNGNALDNRQVRIDGNTDGGLIDNIHITNCTEAGLDIQGSSTNIDVLNSTFTNCEYGAWTAAATASLITFTNCKFNNNTADGLLLVNATGVKFENCDFNSNTEDGFSAGSTTTDIQLTNCRAISNGHDGFDAAGVTNWTLTNCIAKSNTLHGFNPSAAALKVELIGCMGISNTQNGVGVNNADEVSIIGGNFSNNGGHGIAIVTSDDVRVIGTHCEENEFTGIQSDTGCNRITIIGNTCLNNNNSESTFSGIKLFATDDSIVSGNICIDTQGVATQFIGISEDTDCDRNTFNGNISKDNTSAAYLLEGTTSVHNNNLADGIDTTVFGSALLIHTTELSSINIKALVGTPITLVAAKGADTVIEFVSATLVYDASGVAYVEPSAPDDMVIEYATGQDITASIDATGFITVTDDESRLIPRDLTAFPITTDLVALKNSAIRIINTGSDYTTGGGVVTIFTTYKVHTLGL